jgi:hypothetical protein
MSFKSLSSSFAARPEYFVTGKAFMPNELQSRFHCGIIASGNGNFQIRDALLKAFVVLF